MKKILLTIGLSALAATACQKQTDNRSTELEESGRVPVSFSIETLGSGATKMNEPSATEDNVDSAFVFVFDGYLLDDFGVWHKGESSLTLNLKKGKTKKAVVIVNPDKESNSLYKGVQSLDDFNALASNILNTEDGGSRFAMSGEKSFNVTGSTTEVCVPISRLAAKVQIDKITNNTESYIGNIDITGIFLTNALASADFFGVEDMFVWVNKMGNQLSEWSWFSNDDCMYTLRHGESTPSTFKEVFYCGPNYTTEDSFASTWCDRHTRLVVRANIANGDYFYPIDLHDYDAKGKVQSNHFYHIKELKIKHIGLDIPEGKIEMGSAGISIEVVDWIEDEITAEL